MTMKLFEVAKVKVIYIAKNVKEIGAYWRKFWEEKAERKEIRRILTEENIQRYIVKKGLRRLGKEMAKEARVALKKDPCVMRKRNIKYLKEKEEFHES